MDDAQFRALNPGAYDAATPFARRVAARTYAGLQRGTVLAATRDPSRMLGQSYSRAGLALLHLSSPLAYVAAITLFTERTAQPWFALGLTCAAVFVLRAAWLLRTARRIRRALDRDGPAQIAP